MPTSPVIFLCFALLSMLGGFYAHILLDFGPRADFHPLLKFLSNRGPDYPMSNWGGNFQFSTKNIQYPRSTAEVANLVANSTCRMRALGNRHSFSTIADSQEMIVSVSHMNQILNLDPTVPSITVEAGMAYTDFCPFLEIMGFALPNLAVLAEISVAGASQTAVHGSGLGNQILSAQISGLTIVLANGTVATFTKNKNPNEMAAMAVGLGAFGIITEVTLAIEPSYQIAQHVFLNMSLSYLAKHFEEIASAAYSVQFFFDYSYPNLINHVLVNSKLGDPSYTNYDNVTSFFGALSAKAQVTPIAALPATYVAQQLGIPGPWYYRLVLYKVGLSGFNGEEVESEYFVPLKNASLAILALSKLASVINPAAYTGAFRTVAADDFWMSHSYQKKTLAIHFTWKPNMTTIQEVLPQVEAVLQPFGAVPHWGKLFYMKPSTFLQHYPMLSEWKQMVTQYDPKGRFRNTFLDENVFLSSSCT